jgi:hypothetical protein
MLALGSHTDPTMLGVGGSRLDIGRQLLEERNMAAKNSAPALLDARKPSAPHGESQPTQDHSDRDCGVDDAVIGVQHTARG